MPFLDSELYALQAFLGLVIVKPTSVFGQTHENGFGSSIRIKSELGTFVVN